MFAQPTYTMVQSGQLLSDPISLRGARGVALSVPTLTAAESGTNITVRAAGDPTATGSASFLPVELTPPNSGPMKFVCGLGGKVFPLGQIGEAMPALQFQFDVAVASPRTLTLFTKS